MEPRNILWKNFTNIDRLVMKVGSNEAPGCTFENEAVHSRRGDHDWWLSMVLVTFWRMKKPRNILWKNFTNIDRLVTKVGLNEAPGYAFKHEAVRSRCGDHD